MYSIHGELYIYTENSSECLPFGVHVLEPRKHLLAHLCVCVCARACVCAHTGAAKTSARPPISISINLSNYVCPSVLSILLSIHLRVHGNGDDHVLSSVSLSLPL